MTRQGAWAVQAPRKTAASKVKLNDVLFDITGLIAEITDIVGLLDYGCV
jgi:hypothetical protein